MNCKDAANPKPVIIHSSSDRRYNPSDLADYMDDLGVKADDAEEAAGREWSEQFHDKPLKLDQAAEIPQTKLAEWIKSDPRFRETWFRQRTDMKDQSQSGYDLALADFGYGVDLSEQVIVDLLIHHRRIHHQKAGSGAEAVKRRSHENCLVAAMSGSCSPPRFFPAGFSLALKWFGHTWDRDRWKCLRILGLALFRAGRIADPPARSRAGRVGQRL
jgi:hypothetical protein